MHFLSAQACCGTIAFMRNSLYDENCMLPDPSFGTGKVPEGTNAFSRCFKQLRHGLKRRTEDSEKRLRNQIAQAFFQDDRVHHI